MTTIKLLSHVFLFASLSIFTSAEAAEVSCNDGAGSTLKLVKNSDTDSQADILVLLGGPAADFLFPVGNRDFLANRYGHNEQDYRVNSDGKLTVFTVSDHGLGANVLAYRGGRYEPQLWVRRDFTGLKVTDGHKDWYFGSCR